MAQHTEKGTPGQASMHQAEVLSQLCYVFLQPVLVQLHQELDRRLVQTLLDLLQVIILHRHRQQGLLLSELGGHLLGAAQAPAGTKRIDGLLKSRRWQAATLMDYLWDKGDEAVQRLTHPQDDIYVIWDESVVEKPESLKAERLGPVRSSKARRLLRIKPGYYTPPRGPAFVPGWNWLQLLVAGPRGPATLAHLRWWTTRGAAASDKRTEEAQLLEHVARRWGRQVVHIWDQGFAGAPWVRQALQQQVRFILRWKKSYKLVTVTGQLQKAWECARGKRSLDHRLIYDSRRRCERKTGVVYLPVRVPDVPGQLWLVVARPGQGRTPWYLLTNEPIADVAAAWQVVFAYSRRWQVEIVQSQMTKAGVLTAGAGRNDITNLDFVVGDNHSINEQFNQLPFLRKGRVGQARLDALAERFDRGGQTRQFGLAIDMAVELLLLGFQRLGFLLQLPASPLIFG